MAEKALPIIFLNLSGEMIYVIQQRLEAQNISEDKSKKVIQDIISTMLNDQFIEELFKPQHMYSRSAMQSVFEKLVHSSIMRLNANSMGKLYDLMLMVFKYQVVNCQDPEDILLVTLNHMDAIRDCAMLYPELKQRIENVHLLLISNYKDLAHEDYECLYSCIIAFLQDLNIRVSVLMKLGFQLPTGEIVCAKSDDTEKVNCNAIAFEDDYISTLKVKKNIRMKSLPDNCFDICGDRGTTLGTNIYLKSALLDSSKVKMPSVVKNTTQNQQNVNIQVVEEITLLGRLIGKCSQSDFVPEIMLSSNDEDMGDLCNDLYDKNNSSVVKIDASKICQTELGKISNELFVKEGTAKNDILELLDIVDNDGA